MHITFFILISYFLWSINSNAAINYVIVNETIICSDTIEGANYPEPNNETLIIEAGDPIIWDNLQSLPYKEIIIEPEAQLIVKSDTYLNKDAKIVVQRGGELMIDGGGLIGSCMWQGIELWGNASLDQSSYEQGLVKILNGGKIENTEVAIKTCKIIEDPDGGEVDYDYTGGIVQATGATFRNNHLAVVLYDYEFPSQSNFSDCDFIVNDSYNGENDPDYFIKMFSMNNVDFTYCRFTNESSEACYGKGIYGFNSRFKVEGKCTSGTHPCTEWENGEFTNLERGIYATSGGTVYFPEISHTDFTGNHRGVYFSAMENGSVKNCTIYTGPTCAGGSYGIYLDRSTGYTIEDNYFYQGLQEGIGMVINNSGPDPNMIYRNYFEGLTFAIIAQQENRNRDGTGLVLKCNEYFRNDYDEVVTWKDPFVTAYAGIAAKQGANLAQPDGPAGNRFSYTGPEGTPTDIYNEANDITYYYHVDISAPLMPKYYTDETVNPFPNEDATWDPDDSCPPTGVGGGGSGDEGGMKGMMASSSYKADSVQSIINILKDGGSTEDLKWDVDMSTPPETYQVYNELMNNSPYISDTVMEAAIEKEDVLPNVMIRDVMVANPHNAKDESLMERIDERTDPMPEYMKAQILQGQSLVSVFENLQSNLAFYKQQRSLAFNGLVNYYLTDTVNSAGSLDSLTVLLENENIISTKYRLAFLCMEQGTWSMGQIILNNIPQQFNLTVEDLEVHQQSVNYYNLLAGLAQEDKPFAEADSAQLEVLFEIEALQEGKPSVYARNILLALDEIVYDEPIFMPDFMKSSAVHEEYEEYEEIMKSLDEHYYLKIFPNPAGDYLIIEHKLETEPKNAFVKIRNSKGEIVKHVEITGKQNQQTPDIKSLKTGVYIATLYVNDKELESIKFTKVK
ncbi:MAG: right-handed parallel beta-helix repeat-containing protein [Bacteroidales bacterium]|nr:right-handed parallel beta-helix repeat-containing protein [Bacteroidales bacterium]